VFWPGIRAGYWGRLSVTVNHGALSKINACASGRGPGSSSSVASADAVERHCAGSVCGLRECRSNFANTSAPHTLKKAAVRARRRLVERDKVLAGEKVEIGGGDPRPRAETV
jgi:hypothetical protein